MQEAEQCDDSNLVSGDGCNGTCSCELCGDGYKCKSEQCDDNNVTNGDGCSSICKIEGTCSDGVKNQGEIQTDCGGPCPVCPCVKDADCNDGLYCTVDWCSAGFCEYIAYNPATNPDPCKTDFPRICTTIQNCVCNEKTNTCDLCTTVSKATCKATSNTLCQDYGNPTGCYLGSGNWCCPGRE